MWCTPSTPALSWTSAAAPTCWVKEDDVVGLLDGDDIKDLKPLNDRVLVQVRKSIQFTVLVYSTRMLYTVYMICMDPHLRRTLVPMLRVLFFGKKNSTAEQSNRQNFNVNTV